ncbi:MAG: PEP-CTERM sorting domain-containing protein [Bryobacteraceae bacterium]|nr:PEP-CTERM sorting domain-containing protein [Bryobacteraceae bacterium]
MKFTQIATILVAGLVAGLSPAFGATVFSASGADQASITPELDLFRASLGALNANNPEVFVGGRREINWNGVPAASSDPFPGDFFNGNTPGRARGNVNTTPGDKFITPIPGAADEFASFSGRAFLPVGSFQTDVFFFSPADQKTPSKTNGFGVIFLDVDDALTASMEFFTITGASLGKYDVAPFAGEKTFSFLGVKFDNPDIFRVRIVSGTTASPAAMDDFIYGEPVPTPEPSTYAMLGTGLIGAWLWRKKRA